MLAAFDYGRAMVKVHVTTASAAREPMEWWKLGDALRAQIWANPTDAEALRVYADWLAEHGERTRAEYIQLCLLADPTEAQRARARGLRAANRSKWLGDARAFVNDWVDSDATPGFVDRVTCPANKLLEGFEAVLALGPRLRIHVTIVGKKRVLEQRLAGLPLGRAHGLAFRALDDKSLGTLVPALSGVRALAIDNYCGSVTAAGVATLGRQIASLETLELHHLGGTDVARVLVTEPGFRSVRRLVFNCVMRYAEAPVVHRMLVDGLPALTELDGQALRRSSVATGKQ